MDVRWSLSHELCVFVYENRLVVNVYYPSDKKVNDKAGFQLKKKYLESNFDSKIQSVDFWQNTVIVFTELSIYCLLPKIFGLKEIFKAKIASYSNFEKIQAVRAETKSRLNYRAG
jgi:hypothetical protein